jgi:hypothetical protein
MRTAANCVLSPDRTEDVISVSAAAWSLRSGPVSDARRDVTLTDIQLAEKQGNVARVAELKAMRSERFELMEKLAKLPADMVFFTQITMEAGEDTQFLDAMRLAHIKGALVGVE